MYRLIIYVMYEPLFGYGLDKSALADYVLNELRERLRLICFVLCFVDDNACVVVNAYNVAVLNVLCRFVALKNRKSYVD